MANLKDIAFASGVSIRTVARVINGNGYVGADTRQRVEQAAQKLGYRANRVARSLKTQKSYEIAVAAFSIDELHTAKIAGFEQAMRGAGYTVSVLMGYQLKGDAPFEDLLEELLSRRPAGVAVFPTSNQNLRSALDTLAEHGIPHITLDSRAEGVDSVRIDRAQGVYEAVLYLAAKGRKRIAYLGNPKDPTRVDGYRRALAQLDRKEIILRDDASLDTYERGRNGAALWVSAGRPDAVQVHTDEMALGFLAGLHDLGVKVPAEVAVVGFDDRRAAALSWPRLTTVAQPNVELGQIAAEILLRKIAGENEPPGGWTRTLPTRLVIRESA